MKESPYDTSGCLSKLLFLFPSEFIKYPNERFKMPAALNTDAMTSEIIKHWSDEVNKPAPNFFKCLVKALSKEFVLLNIPLALEFASFITLGYSVGRLAEFYYSNDSVSSGFLYSVLIVLSLVMMRLSRHHAFFISDKMGMKLKYALSRIMYQKICKISYEVVNSTDFAATMSNLTRYFIDYFDYFTSINYLFIAPVAWVSILLIIYFLIGYAGIVGIFFMILTVPIQLKFNKLASQAQQKVQQLTESKLRLINETFEGIKVIKSNKWENIFYEKITKKRVREMKMNKRLILIKSIHLSLRLFSQIFSSIITFGIILNSQDKIPVYNLFFAINLLYLSDAYMATMFPVSTDILVAVQVGCKPFQKFLLSKEKVDIHKKCSKGEIQIRDIVSYWSEDHVNDPSAFYLNHVSLSINPGDLCVLYGPTGSGKSALMLAMIGEIFVQHGSIYRGGKIAYIKQDPWIHNGTIRENIVLGKEFNEDSYANAINLSMLTDDLTSFTKSDMTKVGSKGNILSGGQRSRIGLARAIYSNADIYIFDNPLGSLDAKMAKEITENLIINHLGNRTRVLATYLTDFVQEWMKVIKMDNGSLKIIKGMELQSQSDIKKKIFLKPFRNFCYKSSRFQTIKSGTSFKDLVWYLKSVGFFYITFLFLLYCCSCGWHISYIYFLTKWSTDSGNNDISLIIVLICSCNLLLTVFIRNAILSVKLLDVSSKIHDKVIRRILATTADFFESETKNKILKRFNSDFAIIDQQLPMLLCEILQLAFLLISSTISIIISNPWVIILIVLVFVAVSLNLKYRLPKVLAIYVEFNSSKVPILSHVTSTAEGIFSIRSYKMINKFNQTFINLIQSSCSSAFSYYTVLKLFSFTTELILLFMVIGHVFVSIVIKSTLNPALLSTSLSFIMNTFFTTSYFFVLIIRFLSCLSSVTFMRQILKFPKESSYFEKELKLVKGEIVFDNVELMYENGTVALNGVSFEIKGGSRAGIVGKSGSGKSTIINALIRFNEITGGRILIDGGMHSEFSLASIRDSVCIVPQTPLIFEDSIRFNIDPEGKHADNEIWLVLRLVEMDVKVMALIGSLDAVITTGSLSLGEKQMISLARSMIKRSKILILDEVMSNVNYSEEMRLYDAIDSVTGGCTVMIITHRLDSLISCGTVVMISDGKCIEAGNPKKLLQDKKSEFYNMVKLAEGGISSLRKSGILNFLSKGDELS